MPKIENVNYSPDWDENTKTLICTIKSDLTFTDDEKKINWEICAKFLKKKFFGDFKQFYAEPSNPFDPKENSLPRYVFQITLTGNQINKSDWKKKIKVEATLQPAYENDTARSDTEKIDFQLYSV